MYRFHLSRMNVAASNVALIEFVQAVGAGLGRRVVLTIDQRVDMRGDGEGLRRPAHW